MHSSSDPADEIVAGPVRSLRFFSPEELLLLFGFNPIGTVKELSSKDLKLIQDTSGEEKDKYLNYLL